MLKNRQSPNPEDFHLPTFTRFPLRLQIEPKRWPTTPNISSRAAMKKTSTPRVKTEMASAVEARELQTATSKNLLARKVMEMLRSVGKKMANPTRKIKRKKVDRVTMRVISSRGIGEATKVGIKEILEES